MNLRRAQRTGLLWAVVAAFGSILSGLFAGKIVLVVGALLTGYLLCLTTHAYRVQTALDRRRHQQRALRRSLDTLCALNERARTGRPLC